MNLVQRSRDQRLCREKRVSLASVLCPQSSAWVLEEPLLAHLCSLGALSPGAGSRAGLGSAELKWPGCLFSQSMYGQALRD